MKAEDCKTLLIHEETVKEVEQTLPANGVLYGLSDFFKVLGDSTRIKILHALYISEMCVCDISAVIGISRSAVSHQLRVLRQANLVKYRREGKVVFYSLSDEHVRKIIDQGLAHTTERG